MFLADAKELGIVEVKIHSPFETDDNIMDALRESYSIQGGSLINGVNSKSMTEKMIVKSSYDFIKKSCQSWRVYWYQLGKHDRRCSRVYGSSG